MRTAAAAIAFLILTSTVWGAEGPQRKRIVMYKGEQLVVTTEGSIATVTAPAGTNDGANQIVRYVFDQYGRNIALQALKVGEVKLLVENTDSQIGEIAHVIVTDKPTSDRYRYVVGALTGIQGIASEDIHVAGDQVIVTGNVYSVPDLSRCSVLETQKMAAPAPPPRKPRNAPAPLPKILCMAHLSSGAPAIYPQLGYIPAVSLQINETASAMSGGPTTGMEGSSSWAGIVRLGDIPVLTLTSPDRVQLIARAARFAKKLDRSVVEWKKQAESNRVYPTTFNARLVAGTYEIGMTWKYDQGTRGEALIGLTPEELQQASVRSGGGSDRLIQWWSGILQDAFRLYYLATRPSRTLSSAGQGPLLPLYQNALRLSGSNFERSNAPVALARSYFSIKSATGKDPFENLLTQPPADFQPGPITQ